MLGSRDSEIAIYVQDNAMVRIFNLIKKGIKREILLNLILKHKSV